MTEKFTCDLYHHPMCAMRARSGSTELRSGQRELNHNERRLWAAVYAAAVVVRNDNPVKAASIADDAVRRLAQLARSPGNDQIGLTLDFDAARDADTPEPIPAVTIEQYQSRIARWVLSTLGEECFANKLERALRVVEETVELAQAVGVDPEQLHRLVDYVYERPKGVTSQELAGIMVTLCAMATSLGVKLEAASLQEADRIETPEIVDKVRRRQTEKRESLIAMSGEEELGDGE